MDSYPNKSLSQVANSLYTLEPISGQTVEQLLFIKSSEQSCYIGLINILYNIARQYSNLNKQKQSSGIMVEESKVQDPVQEQININSLLSIRGQILKEHAKLLKKILPQPAYSLARFQFQDFNRYCINRGLSYLMRHIRGIYPLIDTKRTPALQFLPFYLQLINNNSTLIGNENWKFARKSVDAFYEQQIKTGRVFKSEQIDQQTNAASLSQPEFKIDATSNQDSEQYERTGIRFCYIMLTGRQQQMQAIIADAQKRAPQKDTQQAAKFNETISNWRFWFDNYSKFMEEGIKMYETRKQNNQLPLIYGQKAGLQFTIIELIQQTLELIKSKQPGRIAVIKLQIDRNISKVLEIIVNADIFQGKSELSLYQTRMLLLSYLYVVHKTLLQNDLGENKVFQAYEKLNNSQIPSAQPFNRIFYNDAQLLNLYKTGKINRFPVVFNYGSELLRQILKIITSNKQSNLADNLIHLAIIDTMQRFSLLVKSSSIGDIHQIRKGTFDQTAGEKILNFLESRKDEFKQILEGKDGRKLMPMEANRHINQFIRAWRQIYDFARNYSLNYFRELQNNKFKPVKYNQQEQLKQSSSDIDDQNREDTVRVTDLVHPMSRPDIIYRVLQVFLQNMSTKTTLYTDLLEQQNNVKDKAKTHQQIQLLRNQLMQHVITFKEEKFKAMLNTADSNFIQGHNKKSQYSLEKQKFQDFAWKTYASTFLLFSEFCKELVSATQKSEHEVPMSRAYAPKHYDSDEMEQRSEEEQEVDEQMIDEDEIELSSDQD